MESIPQRHQVTGPCPWFCDQFHWLLGSPRISPLSDPTAKQLGYRRLLSRRSASTEVCACAALPADGRLARTVGGSRGTVWPCDRWLVAASRWMPATSSHPNKERSLHGLIDSTYDLSEQAPIRPFGHVGMTVTPFRHSPLPSI